MKIKLLFFALIVLFTACGKEEMDAIYPDGKGDQVVRLYGVKSVKDVPQTKGTAQKNRLWFPGTNIKIKFLDGTPAMQEEVKTYAAEWLKYAGMGFEYVTTGKADVRITFDKDDDRYVTWSYTGTDCKYVPQNEATMNLAFWSELTADEKRGDVLRAYGQMLGLELEHRHLKLEPTWGSRIESYWTSELGDIPWETLRECVFDPLNANDVIATQEYDAESVMIWPFTLRGLVTYPAGYTVPKEYNTQLSEMDKKFIGTIYPKPEEEYIVRIKVKTNGEYPCSAGFFNASEPITIDWGDGSEPEVTTDDYGKVYDKEGEYEIKVYGNSDAIFRVGYGDLSDLFITEIDVSKCSKLKVLYLLFSDELTTLDISKNKELETLYFHSSLLTKIDLSNNLKLKSLSIDNNNLTELDLSNNVKLEFLSMDGNPFMNDENKVLSVINSLPDRSHLAKEGQYRSDQLSASQKDMLAAKNWRVW